MNNPTDSKKMITIPEHVLIRARTLARVFFMLFVLAAAGCIYMSLRDTGCPEGILSKEHRIEIDEAQRIATEFQRIGQSGTSFAPSYLIPATDLRALIDQGPDFIQIFNGRTANGAHTLVFTGANVDRTSTDPYLLTPVYVSTVSSDGVQSVAGVDRVQPPGVGGIANIMYNGSLIRVRVPVMP